MKTPPIKPTDDLKPASGFPREFFWPALRVYRKLTVYAGISGVNFADSLRWIQDIHSKYFSDNGLEECLSLYQALFTERVYILSGRIFPAQQIFSLLDLTPSAYMKIKTTLIENYDWLPKKYRFPFTPASYFSQIYGTLVSINRKARCLVIHSQQYATLSTFSKIRVLLHTLPPVAEKSSTELYGDVLVNDK